MNNQQHLDLMGLTIAGNILIELAEENVIPPEKCIKILCRAQRAASQGQDIKENPQEVHVQNVMAILEAMVDEKKEKTPR